MLGPNRDAYKRQRGDNGTIGTCSATLDFCPSAVRGDGDEASPGSSELQADDVDETEDVGDFIPAD
jgi:hypothetical protein